MKLAASVKLIFLASIMSSFVAVDFSTTAQTEPDSSTSAQQENPSSLNKYSLTFNRQSEVSYLDSSSNAHLRLPLFPLLEAMGVEYTWNQSQNTVFTSNNGNTIELQVGKDFQTLNGYPVPVTVSKGEDGEIWIENKYLGLTH